MGKIQVREKALKYGIESLNDSELFALVIKSGSKDKNVMELTDELIQMKGGMQNIFACNYDELISIKGLGKAKALELLAIIEISKRFANFTKIKKEQLDTPKKIASWIKFNIAFSNQETFFMIYLSKAGHVLKYEKLFKGTNDHTSVSIDEVARRAVLSKASYIIISHNHPSGLSFPSNDDIIITKKIADVLKMMNIVLLDHIIVTREEFYSFKQNDLL